jgi:hypothetical protein
MQKNNDLGEAIAGNVSRGGTPQHVGLEAADPSRVSSFKFQGPSAKQNSNRIK